MVSTLISALFKTAPRIDSETSGAARRARCTTSAGVRPHSITSTYASTSSVVAQTSTTGARGERSTITNWYRFRNSSKTRTQFIAGENGRRIRRPRVGNRREERHLGRLILPNNLLNRRLPKNEFDNSTRCFWSHGARQRWVSEVTVNKHDGSAIARNQLGERQRDSRFSLVWSCGSDPNDPSRPRLVLQIDRQFHRAHALREP